MARKTRRKPRKLDSIPNNSVILADANILAYHINEDETYSPQCSAFLNRGVRCEINIVTSPQIVSDVIHRSMIVEATKELNLDPANLANYLKTHPQVVRQLKEHLNIPSFLAQLKVNILPLTHIHHHHAKQFRQAYGLMADDSLILGLMKAEKIQYLATNDRDFRRVKEIIVWEP